MKHKILLVLLGGMLMGNLQTADAFVYQGVEYYVPLGSTDPDLICGTTPICYVRGLADHSMTNLIIPPDWVFDENNNAYWPIAIEAGAFENEYLSFVDIGTVQKIGGRAFKGCSLTQITSLTVKKIGDEAFANCQNLLSAQFAAVTDIGQSAFAGCSLLATADFPLVNNIGDYAFSNCNLLSYFYFPWPLQSVGRYAFYNCAHLSHINYDVIGLKLFHTVPEGCFKGCHDLENFDFVDCITRIENSAFEGCSSLDYIFLSDDISYVGENAFKGCTQLTTVYIDHYTISAYHAFAECPNITKVRIGRKENSMLFDNIFPDSKNSLQELEIRDGSTSIGKIAEVAGTSAGDMMNYTQLHTVTIPQSVKVIGDLAFYGCSALKNVNLPAELETIGADAFAYTGIGSLSIPDKTTYLGSMAFQYCTQLKDVSFGTGLTYVPAQTFLGCSSLEKIYLPKNIVEIGHMAFSDCTNLQDVTIACGLSNLYCFSTAFERCPNIRKLGIYIDFDPNERSSMQLSSLFNLSNLEELNVLEGSKCLGTPNDNLGFVYGIGYSERKLRSVILPPSIETIGTYALYGCSSMEQITCKAATPPSVCENAFENVSRSIPVYVPKANIGNYKAAPIWKEFSVMAIPESTEDIQSVTTDNTQNQKILCNGQILILRGDKTYTLTGAEVK